MLLHCSLCRRYRINSTISVRTSDITKCLRKRAISSRNQKKSMCIRFGKRFSVQCTELVTASGSHLKWVDRCCYLGVYSTSGCSLRCCFEDAKSRFFSAFNAIFSKTGHCASEPVILSLLRSKCMPILLYAVETCPVLVRDKQSLEFTISRSLMKLFRTGSANIIIDCQKQFQFLPVSYLIDIRTTKVLEKFTSSENLICSLFAKQATKNIQKIFSKYGNKVKFSKQLTDIIEHTFFYM